MLTPPHRAAGLADVLAHACADGQLETAQWLCDRFELTAADARRAAVVAARDSSGAPRCGPALHQACAGGHLAVAQWLTNRFGLAPLDAQAAPLGDACEATMCTRGSALNAACAGGHLEVAQWLVTRFGLAAGDARARTGGVVLRDWSGAPQLLAGGALHAACAGGHLAVARWLVPRFGLDVDDARATEESRGEATALDLACANGHLAVAQWLESTFALAGDAVGARRVSVCDEAGGEYRDEDDWDYYDWGGEALHWACENGHLGVAQWLADTFGTDPDAVRLGREQAVGGGNVCSDYEEWCAGSALRRACAGGHLAAAQWLADRFGLAADEDTHTGAEALEALGQACAGGHLEVAEWLATRFEISADAVRWPALLHQACDRGRLAVAQWLCDRFGLTGDDEQPVDDRKPALHRACANGHLAVAQWIAARFERGALDAQKSGYGYGSALNLACIGNHFAVARWLADDLGCAATAADLRDACWSNCDLAFVQWLAERAAPTAAQLQDALLRVYAFGGIGCERPAFAAETAEWLVGRLAERPGRQAARLEQARLAAVRRALQPPSPWARLYELKVALRSPPEDGEPELAAWAAAGVAPHGPAAA